MRRKEILWCTPLAISLLLLCTPKQYTMPVQNFFTSFAVRPLQVTSTNTPPEHPTSLPQWVYKKAKPRKHANYLVGSVLFRSSSSWNSSLWINLGKENGDPHILQKNSPVLSGDSVVGIIEYIGKNNSLVRLITDSAITPSVRVLREDPLSKLHEPIKKILTTLKTTQLLKETEQKALYLLLEELQENIPPPSKKALLAKGELQGHGEPLWRTPGPYLKGIGFNYDFDDTVGPSRDLRTGGIKNTSLYEPLSLLQVGDLLVTSGMDGIFPEGLKIATVVHIEPLQEGAYAYELTAKPTADALFDLDYVYVLPPTGFSKEEIPSKEDRIIEQIEEVS